MYGFTDVCNWFVQKFPKYFVASLRINGSGIESLFSLLMFSAAGNLSASNYGSIRGRGITGKEVVMNSNSEKGYRDDRILISGSLDNGKFSVTSSLSSSVRVVFDPFGLDGVKEIRFSSNLSQSAIGGRQGSNACTLISLLMGYHFQRSILPQLTRNTLASTWFESVTSSLLQGNELHDLLFDSEPRILDVEDAVESCVNEVHLSHHEEPIGYDHRSGDTSPLVETLTAKTSLSQNQTAVLITEGRTMAVLLWETGDCAIVDSHTHGQFGAMIGYALPGEIKAMVCWLPKMVLKHYNVVLGLSFVSYEST